MGLFSKRSRQSTALSHISNVTSSASTSTPNSPFLQSGSSFGRSGRSTPSLSSPNPNSSSLPSSHHQSQAQAQIISLRVAIDPIPLKGNNEDAKNLFYIQVSPEEGIAAIRREIARTVGHGSMGLFKVSIPYQAHGQSRSYTERYGKSVNLLSQFPAFNLDDSTQLELSIESAYKNTAADAIALGELKIKHWFPDFATHGSTDHISIIARPLQGMPINTVPLTLRAYLAHSPQTCSPGPSTIRTPSPPLVIDIDPYITVNELKSEILRTAGQDAAFWRSVVLWQIAMTESEMDVINQLGRLKNGKMPWPYPPGAMEPIPMTDGNLPVSLFFPRSAPNGDMLNLSVWVNPTCGADSATLPALARDIPHFRYPMAAPRPASIQCPSPELHQESFKLASPVSELPPASSLATLKVKARRNRPSTAPAAVNNMGSGDDKAKIRSFGAGSTKPPPPPASIRSSSIESKSKNGLGIVTTPSPSTSTTPLLDRTSFSSTESSESIVPPAPSLSFSQLSLDTLTITNVNTPHEDGNDWLTPRLNVPNAGVDLKKTVSINRGSLRDRLRKVM
ncbi:uncharacterized protein IL334_007656 [Kwoniella shivajii]|uniref:Uncharacterized protein n=1 Tax=Kwoniella shivajii TaxID=564305 RepID=A0ABZ1D9A0_9TREE|nr:hypothetical protein IL334_007656 [Kwoniella shivajii]